MSVELNSKTQPSDAKTEVPLVYTVESIYTDSVVESQRYIKLIKAFAKQYGHQPNFIVRAPGRVNIIGEHIDYCGFGVLPMGIEKDVIAAVAIDTTSKSPKLSISNVDSTFSTLVINSLNRENSVDIDSTQHLWTNYCLAGYKGALIAHGITDPISMKVTVDGNVPIGSGLSSSSAMVVTFVIATSHANSTAKDKKLSLDKKLLAQTAVESERFVGVNGGGMDQSCSLLAERNQALFIEFEPTLNTTNVQLPNFKVPMSFVVANSRVVSNKFVSKLTGYNLRVVETRLAAYLLAKKLSLLELTGNYPNLNAVLKAYTKTNNFNDKDLLAAFDTLLHQLDLLINFKVEGYTLQQLSDELAIPLDFLTTNFLTKYPVQTETFHLYKRAKHVYSEAKRVIQFKHLCQLSHLPASANSTVNPKQSLDYAQELGKLMNASQDSCNLEFDCSCPQLQQLTKLSLKSGALGSRLSGAGWGGCTISLVPTHKLNAYLSQLRAEYYSDLDDTAFGEMVFATQPGQGAVIMDKVVDLGAGKL